MSPHPTIIDIPINDWYNITMSITELYSLDYEPQHTTATSGLSTTQFDQRQHDIEIEFQDRSEQLETIMEHTYAFLRG